MRYFITGITGFIGRGVTRHLLANGDEVIGLVRSLDQARDLQEMGVALHQGDVISKDSMRDPMAGVDGVFHFAGWYRFGMRDRSPAYSTNVEGTRNTLELMDELGIPRGVYSSTLTICGDTQGRLIDESFRPEIPKNSEYLRTKWLAHYEVAQPMMDKGLPLIIIQPSIAYGPGDTSQIGQARIDYLRRRLPVAPQETAFCWAHIDDLAEGIVQAMKKGTPGESYILGGPCHTFMELLQTAQRMTGIPLPLLKPSPTMMRIMAKSTAVVEKVIPLPPSYRAESLWSMIGTRIGSSEKARKELGFDPRPLEEGLRDTLEVELAELGIKPRPGSLLAQ